MPECLIKLNNMKKPLLILLVAFCTLISCNSETSKRSDILKIDREFKSGEIEKAYTNIENYLVKNTDNEYAWTLAGHIYAELEKDAIAFEAYNKALALNKNTVEAITGLGILERKKGNYDQASDHYYKAIEIDPSYAEAYSSLVVINLKRRKFKEAVEVGEKGYQLEKKDGVIAANLAVAYHYAGDSLNREKFYSIAKINGYRSLDGLRQIFNGELTVLD